MKMDIELASERGWKKSRKRRLCQLPWGLLHYLFCLHMPVWPCMPWLHVVCFRAIRLVGS